MTASADFRAPAAEQMLLRGLLRGVLRLFFRGLVRPPMPVSGQRRVLRMLTAITLTPRGVSRSAATLAGRPCEWHRPPGSRGSVLLYLHGGAFMIGGPDTHRGICASLAKRGALDVCALDYRLAPEHPYPAARDDVVSGYQALLQSGYRPEQIAIGGDSAGATSAWSVACASSSSACRRLPRWCAFRRSPTSLASRCTSRRPAIRCSTPAGSNRLRSCIAPPACRATIRGVAAVRRPQPSAADVDP